jgi:hypothetical protein
MAVGINKPIKTMLNANMTRDSTIMQMSRMQSLNELTLQDGLQQYGQ